MYKRLKIAHLVCTFPPYKGGMGNVAFEQVSRLSQKHELTIFSLSNHTQSLIMDGFEAVALKAWLKFGNAGFCPQILFKLRKFDVIQLHYPFFGVQEVLWLAKILGLLKNTKLIIFYHMDPVLQSRLLKVLSLPSRLIQKSLLKIADKICCASLDYIEHSNIKDIYAQHRHKFVEIPFGSKFINFKSKDSQILNGLNISRDDKIVLFVGGLDSAHNFKGVDILINAFYQLVKETQNSNYKLIIVGDGDLRSRYTQQVQDLNLPKQIIFAGAPTDQELAGYYQICELLVLPSTSQAEAFGLVLVETKAFAKAVIGSDLPGVRGVVGDKTSGLVVRPGDIDDLCSKLKTLLADDEMRRKFGRAGQKQVQEKYNWDRHTQSLEQVYNQL